jgi:hypothetical protein
MRRVFALLMIAMGCYHPTPSPGAPCGPGESCPSGLECRGEICVIPGSPPGDGPPLDSPPPDGPPADAMNVSGCADGLREGFTDLTEFPDLAGCGASWTGAKSLRTAKTGNKCGDDLDTCPAPADACDEGWSICGDDGDPNVISNRATAAECAGAGGIDSGAFAAALSHCTESLTTCVYDNPYPCTSLGDCSEPVCCGPGCSMDLACKDGVYPDPDTVIAGDQTNGCGAFLASSATGVLCCRD